MGIFGRVDNRFEPRERRHEVRESQLERILDADARKQGGRRRAEGRGADRGSGFRENDVEADGAQERALARHVRSGHEPRLPRARQRHVVAHALLRRDQRVAELEAALAVRDERIAELERRVGADSGNSSRPPSSDAPWEKKPAKKRKAK